MRKKVGDLLMVGQGWQVFCGKLTNQEEMGCGRSSLEVSYKECGVDSSPLLGAAGWKPLGTSELEEEFPILCKVCVWHVGCIESMLGSRKCWCWRLNFSGIFGLRSKEAKWEFWV